MKTSVIDVRDMLSVLSVQGVEERIGEVPGVESVTVNHAAATATVRYDETRLHVGDIKSDVRQRGYAAADEPTPKPGVESEPAQSTVQAPPPQSPEPSPQTGAENAAPAKSEKDTAPATPAATPPKGAGAGALPEPVTASAAPPVSEAAPPAAAVAAEPEGEAPGPIEKVDRLGARGLHR